MTGRCATCKWWEPIEWNSWNFTVRMKEAGWCGRAGQGEDWPAEALAYAVCDESRAHLMTLPTYGCVQWEESPETPS